MSNISEKTIEKKVKEYAEKTGWKVYKFVSVNEKGVPDKLFIKNGLAMFIEFKKKGGVLSDCQKEQIKILNDHGVLAEVVDSVEGGIDIIDTLNSIFKSLKSNAI